MKTKVLFLITLLCAAVVRLHSSYGNTITVTNTNDSGAGSLRNALAVANDGDTIDATIVSGTILLTSDELQINHSVIINGPGPGNLSVDGNHTYRVFENLAQNVTISGFTITNGVSENNGAGGVLNHSGLTVSDSNVVSNADGGVGNDAQGIDNQPSNAVATLTITNSTVSGNSGSYGGGIFNTSYEGYAALTVSNCTISGNSGSYGGGIYNEAFGPTSGGQSVVTVTNTTLSGNSVAGDGGAIYNIGGFIRAGASLSITNSTISGNSATGHGGGIYNSQGQKGYAQLALGNTILNAASPGENIFNDGGTVMSHGYNVSSDDGGGFLTGNGDQINIDPMLGPLQDNGGLTFTHALLPGSPAIDTGDPSFTPPPFFDQRGPGFARVVNGRIDKGAFEVQGGGTPTPTPTARPSPTPRPRPTPKPRPISP